MDDRRFDELARTLATSRRGVLKTLIGIAAGGLLALFDPTEGEAQRRPRRPRPGNCNGRRDGARCGGRCGICQGGQCMPDPEFCRSCETCDGSFRCVPVPEGARCAECGVCSGGDCVAAGNQLCPDPACQSCNLSFKTCDPINDGGQCRGECGVCQGGTCQPISTLCEGECELCNPDLFICEPDVEVGLPCGGDCGVCRGGTCEADTSLCTDQDCQICNAETKRCEPLPDDTICRGECGRCSGGQCLPQGSACPEPECQGCDQETLNCVPVNELDVCLGECHVCRDGACVPEVGFCSGPVACQICNPDTGTCEPKDDGDPCGQCGECQGGRCVNELDCGDCGVCQDGQCMPDSGRCAECEVCEEAFDTFLCLPAVDGFPCGGGECGTCFQGGCAPTDEACGECRFCNVALECDPEDDGTVCTTDGGAGGSCESGACVEETVCSVGLQPCGPPGGPFTDFCCAAPPDCEGCGFNGEDFVCFRFDGGDRCAGLGMQIYPPVCGLCCAASGEPCPTAIQSVCCSTGMPCRPQDFPNCP